MLENYTTATPSVVLDDEGNEIARFALDKRAPITFDKLPDVLIKAFIAAEDWNFFNHPGVSFKGILRSSIVNLYHRKVVQGASTITQQLAKLVFLSSERTFLRKVQEIFIAFQIERKFTKEQILELYLNNVYFGRGIYGVEAACQRFWNKSALDVSVDEAATLAAVAKSALYYSPLNSPLSAQKRRNTILKTMHNLKFISQNKYEQAIKAELKIRDHALDNSVRMYIQEWIRIWAEKIWGRDALYKKGLKIKTTINLKMQALAEKTFCNNVKSIRQKITESLNGGMLSMEVTSGKIKAFVGGVDFRESQFNRAFQANRQMGSVFKTILYTSALKAGHKMSDLEIDEPLEMILLNGQMWKPKNWNDKFEGPMTLVRALSLSNNIIAIKLFLKLGPDYVINWARKFGIKNNLTPVPSLALGTAESTVQDVAAAFNVFANYGTYIKPYLIEWVKDENGNKIWEPEVIKWDVLDSKTNSKMINALSHVVSRAKYLFPDEPWLKTEGIGKTGSANLASTTWFVGSTPEYTTCVYLGRDDNKPLGNRVFASTTVFPIWLGFTRELDFQKKQFYLDPDLHEVAIDWVTGVTTNQLQNLKTVKILE